MCLEFTQLAQEDGYASMIISGLHPFDLECAQQFINVVVLLKCTLVCDICLLRFASVLMTSLTMTIHRRELAKKGVLHSQIRST